MSRNAIEACAQAGVALIAFERAAWVAAAGDDWAHVGDVAAAVNALPDAPARVFLAIGKQLIAGFAAKPQHHYLLRLVDAPKAVPLPDCTVVLARGPFDLAGDLALMAAHGFTHIVAKNAGGSGAQAKLQAARTLHLPVILMDRPALPNRDIARSVAEVMAWLGHADLGV
jgi:precorrin-6A/cobalt-precorrin-6A reductase